MGDEWDDLGKQAEAMSNEIHGDGAPAAVKPGLWPEGTYRGKYIEHVCAASNTKGTPGIQITFEVDGKRVTVDCWITGATLAGMTGDQLAVLNWNGEYDGPDTKCEFNPPEVVRLWMKHDTFKGKTRERWNISANAKPVTPEKLASVSNACAAWKGSRPPPANGETAPPKAPPRASTKAPPPPPKKTEKPSATNQDEAWALWVTTGNDDGEKFWAAVDKIAPGKDPADVTPEEWSKVVEVVLPF